MAAIEIETDPSALKHERVMPSTSDSSSASYDCESHSMDGSSDSVDSSAPQSYTWRNIRCSYEANNQSRGGKPVVVEVLHGVDGHLETGQMLAVIGPSGSGKTCLLDILADRKTVGKISGLRLLDGQLAGRRRFQRVTAYVTQEDIFHPTSTVKEAVLFQANLRLDRRMPVHEKDALALRLIEDVGLKGKEHTYVGGPLPGGLRVRGLSGGEKRRLSLCCGTVTAPSLLFLDEPTSGLDGFAALVVMRLLKKYCQRGMMVICTIHQPRAAIWTLFEKVMVLSSGNQMYFGEASGAEAWFSEQLGYPRHHNTSAVDFIMDLVNISFVKDPDIHGSKTMQTVLELEQAAAQFRSAHSNVAGRYIEAPPPLPRHHSLFNDLSDVSLTQRTSDSIRALDSWVWKFRVVLGRNFTNYYRNPGNVLARISVMLFIAGLEALVYFRIGSREAGSTSLLTVTHIIGSIFYSILAVTLLPFASLSLFIYDRQFYSGETNMGSMCVQLSALLAPNQDIAFVLAAGYVAASILTGGFIVSFNSFYHNAKWLQWTSFIKFTFQPLSMNVLRGTNVEFVIDYISLNNPSTIWQNLGCAFAIYVGLTLCAYLALRHLHKERR
ncbi:abc transporter g family protein [Nannochloropsis oceanica]